MTYERKIDFAIKLFRSIPQDGPLEISYSGGKDSDVILRLAQMSGVKHEAIYKQTSIDPPGTTAHAKEMGATIIRPKHTMLQLIERNGWPSRWMRFCCRELKEYKVYERNVMGVRREESAARSKRYKEPEQCRVYPNGEKERIYLPILEWTLEDVARFIDEQGIKCAPRYYDADGTFHPERRLGCIGCPLASDSGLKDFLKYPKMLAAWIKHFKIWWDTHPGRSTQEKFGSPYEKVFFSLHCKNYEEYKTRIGGGLFPETAINAKQYLETYFGIEL